MNIKRTAKNRARAPRALLALLLAGGLLFSLPRPMALAEAGGRPPASTQAPGNSPAPEAAPAPTPGPETTQVPGTLQIPATTPLAEGPAPTGEPGPSATPLPTGGPTESPEPAASPSAGSAAPKSPLRAAPKQAPHEHDVSVSCGSEAPVLFQALAMGEKYICIDGAEQADNALPAGNYYLQEDIALAGPLQLTGTINLCLNGRALTQTSEWYHVLEVEHGCVLNLCDCNGSGASHEFTSPVTGESVVIEGGLIRITGTELGKNSLTVRKESSATLYGGTIAGNQCPTDMMGAAATADRGSLTMEGGRLCHNKGASAAVQILHEGSFTLNGGEITQNLATSLAGIGGGVSVNYDSRFTMNGGLISGNRCVEEGGGVGCTGDLILTGGSITDNHTDRAEGGGLYLHSSAKEGKTFLLSGSPVIQGNTAGEENAASNLYLASGFYDSQIVPVTLAAPLTEGARLGVDASPRAKHGIAVTFTSGWNAQMGDRPGTDFFICDAAGAGYGLHQTGGELALAKQYTLRYDLGGESGAVPPEASPYFMGDLVTLPSGEGLASSGKAFIGWGYKAYSWSTALTLITSEDDSDNDPSNGIQWELTGASENGVVTLTAQWAAPLPHGMALQDCAAIPPAPGGGAWYREPLQITAKPGYTVGRAPAWEGGAALSENVEGGRVKLLIHDLTWDAFYEADFTYSLDAQAPPIGKVQGIPAGWTDQSADITFQVTAGLSGVAQVTVTGPGYNSVILAGTGGAYRFTAAESGSYTITAVSGAGVTTVETVEVNFIDTEAPVIQGWGNTLLTTAPAPAEAPWAPSGQTLQVVGADGRSGVAGIDYRVLCNGVPVPAQMQGDELLLAGPGRYEVTATVTDAVGNAVSETRYLNVLGAAAKNPAYAAALARLQGVHIITNSTPTLADLALPAGWSFAPEVDRSAALVARDEGGGLQPFQVIYTSQDPLYEDAALTHSFPVTTVGIKNGDELSVTTIEGVGGEAHITLTLTVVGAPLPTAGEYAAANLHWLSSHEKIAGVTGDAIQPNIALNALVTARAKGVALAGIATGSDKMLGYVLVNVEDTQASVNTVDDLNGIVTELAGLIDPDRPTEVDKEAVNTVADEVTKLPEEVKEALTQQDIEQLEALKQQVNKGSLHIEIITDPQNPCPEPTDISVVGTAIACGVDQGDVKLYATPVTPAGSNVVMRLSLELRIDTLMQQLKSPLFFTLTLPEGMDPSRLVLHHISGNKTDLVDFTAEGQTIHFRLGSFSSVEFLLSEPESGGGSGPDPAPAASPAPAAAPAAKSVILRRGGRLARPAADAGAGVGEAAQGAHEAAPAPQPSPEAPGPQAEPPEAQRQAGAGQPARCGLCHICPTFLGICLFVWAGILAAAALLALLLLRRRRKRGEET